MNKYYEMFINNDTTDVFKVNPNALSFEDAFWHFACMSLYYQKNNDFYMFKKCLTAVCDLNYYYTAMIYFHAFAVLPKDFEKYIKKFEHPMKNDVLDGLIKKANKGDKKKMKVNFWLYSSFSFLLIPLMLILLLVFKLSMTTSVIIGVVFMFCVQIFSGPLYRKRLARKKRKREVFVTANEKRYFNYLFPIANLLNDKKYKAMIAAEDDAERKIIVEAIQKGKPLPPQLFAKKKKKARKKNGKNPADARN